MKLHEHVKFALEMAAILCLAAAGCGGPPLLPIPAKQPAKPAAQPAAPATSPAAPPASQTGPAVSPAAKATTAAAPPQDVIRQKADVGMGEAGRGYGKGIIATPIKALWFAKERLTLDRIEHDLQIFKAQDPQGRGPKSQQEFFDKIIVAGRIRLPALPPGQRYVYDPAKEELQVEQPRQP
ncbi:MAG: hypothetical protein ABSG86_06925 [Thermoguttaceae bacterium]|jgi:hypothetical protein